MEFEHETLRALSQGNADLFFFLVKEALVQVDGDYDVVVIDCPPQLGFLTMSALSASTGTASMMSNNRALRSARDAVDGHSIWGLDPDHISDSRLKDRLKPSDVADLRDAIETNGQTVPILVRRHPKDATR